MTRQYEIPQSLVKEAWKQVKRNQGAAGIDGITIEEFEADLEKNLYKIWNRMSSGSYFPPPVRVVEIDKNSGGKRKLGIPTVGDRIAQTVVKMYLEPDLEQKFHQDSFGYRPRRKPHDAVALTRKRCWEYEWAIEIDIKAYFDNIDHELLMELLQKESALKFVSLYVGRWLKAGFQEADSTTITVAEKGSPQGSVVSPLLSNLFLHHAFDSWMAREHVKFPFERFADDIIVHCHTRKQAETMKEMIRDRLREWKLELREEKTRIVHCKGNNRKGKYKPVTLKFLGFEFKPRLAKNSQDGSIFTSYLPAISTSARLNIYEQIRKWDLVKRTNISLEALSEEVNPQIRGWLNYYGYFYQSALAPVLNHLDSTFSRWIKRKHKSVRSHNQAKVWLAGVRSRQPHLFAHWEWRLARVER